MGALHADTPTLEELIADVLSAVEGLIGRSDVAAQAPLMDVGLDSLAATHLASRLEQQTGVQLSPTLVFEYSTAGAIAGHLRAMLQQADHTAAGGEALVASGRGQSHEVNVSVAGLSTVLPAGAADQEAVSRAVWTGMDLINTVPIERWVLQSEVKASLGYGLARQTEHGGFVCNADLFVRC